MSLLWRKRLVWALAAAVLLAAIYLPLLRKRIRRTARLQEQSAEQARRELIQPSPGTGNEPRVKAQLFWASPEEDGTVTATVVELALSNEPTLRAKQVLNSLLAGPVDADLRTLPPDAALLQFYLLPDGTGIADFSEPMATSLPSGIQSESLAVESIARTLEANVPQVRRLKILIHGQEAETLAGHVDLTGMFSVAGGRSGGLTPTPAPGKLSAPEKKP